MKNIKIIQTFSTIYNSEDRYIDKLIGRLDPDLFKCPICNQWKNKDLISWVDYYRQPVCNSCILEIDNKNKTLNEFMEEFNEKYQNNPNFLTSEQTLNEHLP